ncbi:hypothetical protein [Sneathia sanguinegens]|uniref:hypothetical protein n=1 Tax=Sneathia sanguinegens TaxID=40543 RepID=UPI00258BF97C|nr:hypothetical protein [Sneathia sanguinegens]MDU4652526.1 hypothetical protein [Sneathia sanguinegens]
MSINKELKFTKWYENHVVDKYEDAPYNYFMDDEWFDSLPNDLQNIIIKANVIPINKEYLYYDIILEELEIEIKDLMYDNQNKKITNKDIQYLLQYLDFCEIRYNEVGDNG